MMRIFMFDNTYEQYMKKVALLLFECFSHSYPMEETEEK
jgi:hypothetical protein